MIKQFKINNPFRPDQKVLQEVTIGDSLTLDYSHAKWIGVDTEFLSFSPQLDELCSIQISSLDPSDEKKMRVEIIHVYKKNADSKLQELMSNSSIDKLFHVFQSDVPRIEKFIGSNINGNIFDTQIAARITLTNMESHSMENLIKYLVDPDFKENKKMTSSEWDRLPEEWEEEQFQYAAEDVLYLYPLKLKLEKVAERRGKKEVLESTLKILPAISNLVKLGYSPNIFGY